ncbi:MAG: PD-(D/E)XK nuclease family protein, partial [Bacteroidota bacterium]|nr:PD-(D/E)XK nuclease family protein [Bacteroidota bacterium]
ELITAEHLRTMIKKVPEVMHRVLNENKSFKGSYNEGKNLLIVNVAQLYITNYLKKELTIIQDNKQPLYIRELEKEFSFQFPLDDSGTEGEIREVKIKGLIDRIDQTGEILRLIDYKSGNVDERKELKLKTPEDLITDPGKSKALQLLIYKFLIEKNPEKIQGSYANIQPGIISLRKFGSYLMPLDDQKAWQTENSYHSFEEILSELLRQIYDPALPFMATTDKERCNYCSFKPICNR